MADPFFTTGNQTTPESENQNNSSSGETMNVKDHIKELLSQQSQIQEKYKELKSLLEKESLDETQIQQVKDQMDKLSNLYSQNKVTLAELSTNIEGEKEIVVNKNIKVDTNSKTKNISFGKLMIGCGVLVLLLIGGLALICYYLIKNPSSLSSIGIDGCTAVKLVQTFSTIFFGILLFVGIGILIVNLYKLITAKKKSKISYIFGTILGLILSIVIGILLGKTLSTLKNLENNCGDIGNSNLVTPSIQVLSDKWKTAILPGNMPRIAPIQVSYTLNNSKYTSTILPKLGGYAATKIELECGNGQKLLLGSNNKFDGTCFYTKAGSYNLGLNVYYNQGQEIMLPQEPLQTITIPSAISVSANGLAAKVNGSELIVGENPVTVDFDASSVFRDLSLYAYEASWSANCDGKRDSELGSMSYLYNFEGVHNVCVKFPGISGDYIYTFPIRVEQGITPEDFSVDYKVYLQTPSDGTFKTISNPENIVVSELPSQIKIEVLDIMPQRTDSTQIKVYRDNEIIPSVSDTYLITIDEDRDYNIKLEVSDRIRGLTTTHDIHVQVDKADIIGEITVKPDVVGVSPFTVVLDASTTLLHDPTDEIIYFSRDFGDGIINKDVSQSIIEHTYEYDNEKGGVYYPSVKVRTKKGLESVVSGVIISVKKPETKLEIVLDDNPSQNGFIGQNIPMSINIDGNPSKIFWDFGDGNTYECNSRACTEISHMYIDSGKYTISANVQYTDRPTLQGTITLLIK